MNPTLSYLIVTKDKLKYLQLGLEKLITHKKPGEEILVADAASKDGTPEYLAKLKAEGKIEYYISEKDYGLAHALNKLILASNGILFKYMTDDDVFDFKALDACKEFMLAHPEIDLINTEGGSLNNPARLETETDPLEVVRALTYADLYKKWMETRTPFYFCDLGVIVRKSSIPITGLWNPSFPGPDIEFSSRVSAGRANIAWYTGYSWVNISNPKSVSMVYMKKTEKLLERLDTFYFDKNPDPWLLKKMRALKYKIESGFAKSVMERPREDFDTAWPKLVDISEKWIDIKNKQKTPEFLYKHAK
jgi:glycosyltransferase involved in cell wall biosynthesis